MPATPAEARERFAREIVNEHTNDWGGSAPVEKIAAARFAVVIERENDAWVLAADSVDEIAGIALSTYTGTEGYDEWVSEIWDVQTGEQLEWSHHVELTLAVKDHGMATAVNR